VIWCNFSLNSARRLQSVSGDRKISKGMWPPRSPDPNLCGIYLWAMLQDRVCSNNPRSEDDLKEDVLRFVFGVSPAEIQRAVTSVLVKRDTYMRAEGNHFRHL
jgi:hypothetical protein